MPADFVLMADKKCVKDWRWARYRLYEETLPKMAGVPPKTYLSRINLCGDGFELPAGGAGGAGNAYAERRFSGVIFAGFA